MIKKLSKKNQKYYVLDSDVIGIRIYVQTIGEKSFYPQRYIKEFKYSKKTKIGDWPEISIAASRKLAVLIKADNVQGRDLIITTVEHAAEKTLGDVCAECISRSMIQNPRANLERKLKRVVLMLGQWVVVRTLRLLMHGKNIGKT